MTKSMWTYILVSFGFSWAVAGVIFASGGLGGVFAGLWLLLFMCGPMVGGLVCAFVFDRGRVVEVLGLKPRWTWWLLIAWGIGVVLVLGATVLSVFLGPGVEWADPNAQLANLVEAAGQDRALVESVPYIGWIQIGSALLLAPLINGVLTLSEELGWRGWLYDADRASGFWPHSLKVGLLWGVWHAPVIAMGHNYPELPAMVGIGMFTLWCVMVTPLFTLIRDRSGSVWGASILHGTINGMAGAGLLLQSSFDWPWKGAVGVGGLMMLGIILVWVVWEQGRKPLSRAVQRG